MTRTYRGVSETPTSALNGVAAGVLTLETGSLLLVEAASQEVHVAVQLAVGVIGPRKAVGALAGMNDAVGHDDGHNGAADE